MAEQVGIYIVAAEKSGDELGAGLIRALKHKAGDGIALYGTGGNAMRAAGVHSDVDISQLSIVSLFEGLKLYPVVLQRVRETAEDIISSGAQTCVLIDSWGFMIRVAKRLKAKGYSGKIIKYVAPQVWATREGRTKVLARYVDHVLSIHSFDAPYFEKAGLSCEYVGNGVFDTDYTTGDGAALRQRLNLPNDVVIIAVLFGSRLSEIQRLSAPFADTVALLKAERPDLVFVSPLSETVATDVRAAAGADLRLQDIIFLPEADKLDVFDAADVALACSGTVTTQLACAGVPTLAAYRLGGATYAVAKRIFKPPFISMINIAADEAIIPEFVQGDCTGRKLADQIAVFLDDSDLRKEKAAALKAAALKMRGEGGSAHERAADAVLRFAL